MLVFKRIILKFLTEEQMHKIRCSFLYNFLYKKEFRLPISEKKRIWVLGTAGYEYMNIGDLAITKNQLNYLKDNFKDYEIIEITDRDYFKMNRAVKKEVKREDIIFLQGGGNMGNEYLYTDLQRMEMIESFPNNRILIFPQTVHLKEKNKEQYLKKMEKIYTRKNLTLYLREENSYKFFKHIFPKVNVELIPDIVLYNKKEEYGFERKGLVMCIRNDFEKTTSQSEIEKVFETLKKDFSIIDKTDMITNWEEKNKFTREEIITNKFKLFSKYKLCVTDRLHGMIFCAITGTPCIAFDNHSKKVSGVYSKWMRELDYIKVVNNIEEFNEEYKKYKESIIDKKHEFNLNLKKYFEKIYYKAME